MTRGPHGDQPSGQWLNFDHIEPGIGVITLTSPETRNALTPESALALMSLCDRIDEMEEVAVTIVTGAGGFFCSGAHRGFLSDVAAGDPKKSLEDLETVYRSFYRVGTMRSITIAAVNGGAVGAGVNLMFATDLRILDTDAKVKGGFVQLGIHPGGGHITLCNRVGGREFAAGFGLLGLELSGQRCQELGIAWEAVAEGHALERAVEVARGVSGDPELARLVKASFVSQLNDGSGDWGLAIESERARQLWSILRRR